MNYVIQTGIPIPEDAQEAGAIKYPWDKMKVGDSIFIPENDPGAPKDDPQLLKLRRRVYNAARGFAAPRNMKFLALVVEERVTTQGEHSETSELVRGVRVWRQEDVQRESGGEGK